MYQLLFFVLLPFPILPVYYTVSHLSTARSEIGALSSELKINFTVPGIFICRDSTDKHWNWRRRVEIEAVEATLSKDNEYDVIGAIPKPDSSNLTPFLSPISDIL